MEQIDKVVYPHKIRPDKEENPDTLSGRITPKAEVLEASKVGYGVGDYPRQGQSAS